MNEKLTGFANPGPVRTDPQPDDQVPLISVTLELKSCCEETSEMSKNQLEARMERIMVGDGDEMDWIDEGGMLV